MINKNVLFPVDTEAYHVIFSIMSSKHSFKILWLPVIVTFNNKINLYYFQYC